MQFSSPKLPELPLGISKCPSWSPYVIGEFHFYLQNHYQHPPAFWCHYVVFYFSYEWSQWSSVHNKGILVTRKCRACIYFLEQFLQKKRIPLSEFVAVHLQVLRSDRDARTSHHQTWIATIWLTSLWASISSPYDSWELFSNILLRKPENGRNITQECNVKVTIERNNHSRSHSQKVLEHWTWRRGRQSKRRKQWLANRPVGLMCRSLTGHQTSVPTNSFNSTSDWQVSRLQNLQSVRILSTMLQ